MNVESYVTQINQIDNEMKRINLRIKELRILKRQQVRVLHEYMQKQNLEKVGTGTQTITIKKCERMLPANSTKGGPLKSRKERKNDEINLLREQGIPHPEKFYGELQTIRKTTLNNTGNNGEPRAKKSKGGYDDMLGF